MDKAEKILKDVFGYDSFRPLQKEIIKNILEKNDSLVVMPTGGGKSLCYQIPALIFNGLTIVISPLISLMKDQVEQLRQLGATTALLNSSLSKDEYNRNYESVMSNKAKLLYIAPESLQKTEVARLLKNAQVDCITVDEAHCISEWGHDFRKDYRQLGNFRKDFPDAVCIGLTATATPRVQDDIIKNLKISPSKKFIASFNRENLFLQIVPKRKPFDQTVTFLNEHKNQSGIIYCFSRKQVDNLNEDLSDLGFSTKPYHAGLSDEERNTNQDLFIKDEVQIIIATIAFGMGINKSNVRFVLHYDLPKNLESYYQEIGRSGRDGVRADCLLLFGYGDISKINYFIEQKENPVERQSAEIHLQAMLKYAETEICRRQPLITYFGEEYIDEYCGMCDNCTVDEKDSDDVTINVQKFLSAIKRTGEIFGVNYIIDVLLGRDTDRIISNGHQNLSVYGIGKELNKKQWQILAHQFLRKDIIKRDNEFGSLKLTDNAQDILFRSKKVTGFIKGLEMSRKKSKRVDEVYDTALFELLRKKRKQIADANNVPPFVIFSDASLIQMANDYPTNEIEFLRISGVGITKLDRFGKDFILVIENYVETHNIIAQREVKNVKGRKSRSDIPRHIIIGDSFNNGKSIKELTEEFNVKPQTIINNLTRYTIEGRTLRTNRLIDLITLDKMYHNKVFEHFNKEGVQSLKLAFDKFNQEISYQDLHILKLIYLNNSNKN